MYSGTAWPTAPMAVDSNPSNTKKTKTLFTVSPFKSGLTNSILTRWFRAGKAQKAQLVREPDFRRDWRKKEIFEREHMTLVRRIPLLVLAVFISLSTAFGQTSGSIRGTVQDPPGAIVAGAKVTATWQERKTSHVASTSTSRNSSSSRINSVELWAGRFSLFRSSAKSARGISNAMWSIVEVAAPSRDNRDSRSGRTRRALECDLRSRPQS